MHRRPASILVLVMTILGLLFVTGVAFMATMNFEATRMGYERQRTDAHPAVGRMMLGMNAVMADAMTPAPGVSFTELMLGTTAVYAELPGVHNLFAPIEPARDANWEYWWPWITDIKALRPARPDRFVGSDATMVPRVDASAANLPTFMHPVNLRWRAGAPAPLSGVAFGYNLFFGPVLDADGDGVADSYAIPLTDVPGFQDEQIAQLKRVLNPASDPQGNLSVGLRVIAHGGLVNLAYSHPALVANVLGAVTPTSANWPYNPSIEEPQLRRRNFLLPQQIIPSGLFGNPLIAQRDPTGGGDYTLALLSAGEALDRHRYWPYGHDELGQLPHNPPNDPDIRIHSIRMDPEYNPSQPQYYDRRHLVTSISHEANIRRSVPLILEEPPSSGSLHGQDEILNLMHQRNIQACLNNQPLPFALPDYPFGLRNQARIVPGYNESFDYTNYCRCMTDVDPATGERLCTLNPRKGRLKLSLRDLDALAGQPALRNQLIYDYFIAMLLNMREPNAAWGGYAAVVQPDGTTRHEWRWNKTGLAELSKFAAALTANLIDYADADDVPTEIAVRALDFSLPLNPVGPTHPGYVDTAQGNIYGIERQPFITEVAAYAIDQDPVMPTGNLNLGGSLFGVELFNPYSVPIELSRYRIVTDRITLGLFGLLGSGTYLGFVHDPASILPSGRMVIPLLNLEFSEGSTITLQRDIAPTGSAPKYITVDSFSLAGTTVGKVEPAPVLDSAQRSSGGTPLARWTSPIPEIKSFSGSGVVETFGGPSGYFDNSLPPVYLQNPDSGAFASAFPTTGMMLMLMRFANATNSAFTEHLDKEKDSMGRLPLDNGRMPVFDPFGVHRLLPQDYYAPNDGLSLNLPGDVMHLPWGQFVFDYFTTLPRSSPGPYSVVNNKVVALDDAPPKVDMDGLRVHGRINLNAAPWKVIEGLPFIPMNHIDPLLGASSPLRTAFSNALFSTGSVPPSNQAGVLGAPRAKAIVAYRELREFVDPNNPSVTLTGDYAQSRGWDIASPQARRGSGFLTLGELANVQHTQAQSAYRLDDGQLDAYSIFSTVAPDYLSAVAVLACLQDWATVRSDTFTVYGTLYGVHDQFLLDSNGNPDLDRQLRDADSRALRFQETISRIPMFEGSSVPTRVGDRVVARYIDARGD